MKGKPNRWGIKIFLHCGESEIVYNIILYQRMSTNIDDKLQKNLGFGEAIVVCLTQNIYAAGIVRVNRFFKPPLMSDIQISGLGRGTSFEITSKLRVSLLKWFDRQ